MSTQAASADAASERLQALTGYAREVFRHPMTWVPVPGDASFRRYFRARLADGRTVIAMDAPPGREDLPRFLRVAALMRAAGVHVPEVYAADTRHGFALLSDLGTRTYLEVITADNADAFIEPALDSLVRWQQVSAPGHLPNYTASLLGAELDLFADWYAGRHLTQPLAGHLGKLWSTLRVALIAAALEQPRVFVHRDYTVRNLMVSEPCPGVIDFQDAVLGPIAYDLLSLTRDAFVSWPPERVDRWLASYAGRARRAGLAIPAQPATLRRWFDLIGVQRHLKVAGIFARLAHRDGKSRYLAEIPRFLGYLYEVAPRYPETARLVEILDGLAAGEPPCGR